MDTLPNELLLEIFENLDYWDPKLNIPNVCNRFRNLLLNSDTKKSKVDVLLFRDHPEAINGGIIAQTGTMNKSPLSVEEELKDNGYTIHPVFKMLVVNKYNFQKNIKDVTIRQLWEYKRPYQGRSSFLNIWHDWPLESLDVANENITSPAITIAHFKQMMSRNPRSRTVPLTIEGTGNGGAITVMDVMKNGICAWAQEGVDGLFKTLNWERFDHGKILNELLRHACAWDRKEENRRISNSPFGVKIRG